MDYYIATKNHYNHVYNHIYKSITTHALNYITIAKIIYAQTLRDFLLLCNMFWKIVTESTNTEHNRKFFEFLSIICLQFH